MIRPAVITDEISQEFEHALDVMLEYGVRDAELRGLWGTNVMELSEGQRQRAKQALEERGMRVCSIASPIFKCSLYPEPGGQETGPLHLATERTLEEQLSLVERAIDLCRYFNTNLVRIFAFWRRGAWSESVIQDLIAALTPAVQRAKEAGIILGLENEHACLVGTGEEAGQVLRAVDSPHLRAIWDPGNAYFLNEEPFPRGYASVRPYLAHVHVKDAVRDAGGKPVWAAVGAGEIDVQGQFEALVRDGYEGWVSLETHYKTASGDPEEASRLCLEGMLRLLKSAGAIAPEA